MPIAPYVWTKEIESHVISAIRSGAFPLVAAEAWGVPRNAFIERLREGACPDAPPEARSFRDRIREAAAFARLKAETHALKTDPLYWLKYGPGKETAEVPGWSNAVRPSADGDNDGTEGEVSLDVLQNFIPALGKVTPTIRETLVTLMKSTQESGGARKAG